MTATEIEQRQCNRFIVLYEVYKQAKADTEQAIGAMELAAAKGIKNGVFKECISYLKSEGLLRGSQSASIGSVYLSHSGVKIVEFIVTNPEEKTDQFPSFKDMGI